MSVHKPKTLSGQRLNRVVDQSMDSVDIVIMCIPADETSGAGDTFIAAEIAKHPKAKKVCRHHKNRFDFQGKSPAVRLLGIMKIAEGFVWDEIIPVPGCNP
jgi:GTP-binding protein Era